MKAYGEMPETSRVKKNKTSIVSRVFHSYIRSRTAKAEKKKLKLIDVVNIPPHSSNEIVL